MSRPVDMTDAKARMSVYAQLLHAVGIEVMFPEGGEPQVNYGGRTFIGIQTACEAIEEAATHIPVAPQDIWEEDEQYPRLDWQNAVANEETNLGYWEWVENQREMEVIE